MYLYKVISRHGRERQNAKNDLRGGRKSLILVSLLRGREKEREREREKYKHLKEWGERHPLASI